MKKTSVSIRILALLLSLFACVPLVSCSPGQKKHTETYFDYFDTFCTLTVYSSKKDFEKYNGIFISELETCHKMLDVYNTYEGMTNLCSLNDNAGKEALAVSDELFAFLEKSVLLYELTDGYTSITMGAVTSLWKNAIEDKTLPDENDLADAAKHTTLSVLSLDANAKTVRITDAAASLDAGALAKGYAGDRIRTALIEAGCESFLINLGGNLTAHGEKPDGSAFVGAIDDPLTQSPLNASLHLSDMTLSTSGSYHRGFEEGGRRYHHIIDPYTHAPQNIYVSVSVLCSDGITADALSTALFSMSYDRARSFADELANTEAVWIFADGSVKSTSGITLN
ncbi:MAG: FAD:protein FMN transferase [Ruminococcaceae bacterium]|nr:FAD:protein FMN transferase [Oscillospiraceae bacterium]